MDVHGYTNDRGQFGLVIRLNLAETLRFAAKDRNIYQSLIWAVQRVLAGEEQPK